MRLLVCGSRRAKDHTHIYQVLDELSQEMNIEFLFAGDATGVDVTALAWAKDRGVLHACFPACWSAQGLSAGPIRNSGMLKHGQPDLVLAFPGGKGTADTVRKARSQNIRVKEVVPV